MTDGPAGNILEIRSLTKRFGGVVAVDDFSLDLACGQIVGLIGPNGAGKTTVFNLITGLDRPDAGTIRFDGRDITGKPAHRITRMGIARTFQNIRLPGRLSVLDNVKIAAHKHRGYGFFDAVLRLPRYYRREKILTRDALELLKMFDLDHLANSLAMSLPYGQRRHLEITRALATEGRLLLLDEPAAGLNSRETADLTELIRRIRDRFAVTILLIEHDMRMVMNLCEQLVVLDYGKTIARGSPDQVKRDPRVVEAYLGRPREPAARAAAAPPAPQALPRRGDAPC
jgi:branched-chain amino acid transport system ATP-binding protein